jgi:hypothetical protein
MDMSSSDAFRDSITDNPGDIHIIPKGSIELTSTIFLDRKDQEIRGS